MGAVGVVISGESNGISNSHLYKLGQGGIDISGGNRITLSAGNNRAKNRYIHDYNRLVKTYRPGIRHSGVGNAVTGNIIESATHTAISFSGNDHIIEYNEITSVVNETGDAGAIYTGRDWTARGKVI